MFSSIACQIKKLDRELDGCKERLHALKTSHAKGARDICKSSKGKKTGGDGSTMNRKKVPAEREYESTCRKRCGARKKLPERCRKCQEVNVSPETKADGKGKRRSRSVSCGKDCDRSSENDYLHNDLGPSKQRRDVCSKNSWANILKECNVQTFDRNHAVTDNGPGFENNKVRNPTSVYLKNRGIQCSEASFVPSRSVSGMTGFTPYNPTRTLHFLLSEIRDNLKHNREDKVLNIINDMEDTIYRLKSNHDHLGLEEKKLYSYRPFKEPHLNNNVNCEGDVNKVFEDGFAKLEGTCKTLEITCARLKEENRQLQLDMERKDSCISLLEKKEKDHLEKINVLNDHIIMVSRKGEQSSETIKELTKLLSKVQQEIKCVQPIKERNTVLESKLSQANEENDSRLYENHILKLENEKLKLLLEIKEKQLSNYKDVFCGLEEKVRADVVVMQEKCKSDDSDIDSSAPLCSSPNTSGSIIAPAYGSWRGLSRVSSVPEYVDPPPCEFDRLPTPENKAEHLAVDTKIKPSFKPLVSLGENRQDIGPIDDLRGQIKMLFSDQYRCEKVASHSKAQPLWTNLNTIHSSVTSYNTTT